MATRGAQQRPNVAAQGKICQFKLVLLGESAVGKSSLVLRFVKGQFHEYQESTIGAAFLTQTVCLDDTTVKFEIWDTAGQERYHSLAPMYYRGAQAAIIVYDITNSDTFGRAKTWVKELQRQASPNIVIALAGNKADLANKRMVEYDEAQAYAEENSLLFMETSAKTAMNVNDIFLAIAKKLPKSETSGTPQQRQQGVRLSSEQAAQQSEGAEIDDRERIVQDLEQANLELRDAVTHLSQEARMLSAKAKDIKVMLECSRARVQELEAEKNRSSSRISHEDEKLNKTRSDLTVKCRQLEVKVAEQEKELTRLRREVIAFAQEEELRHRQQNQFLCDLKHEASRTHSAVHGKINTPGRTIDRDNNALESADGLREILKLYEKQLQEKNKKIRLLEDQRESLKQDLRSSPDVKDHRLLAHRVKKLEGLLRQHNISIPGEKTIVDPFAGKRKMNTRLEHLESLPLEQCYHYLRELCAELQTDDLDCLVDLVRSVREEARNSDRFKEYCQKLSEIVESVNEHSQRHRSYGPNKDLSTLLCDSNMRYHLGVIENWSKDISSLAELQDAINSLLDKVVPWIHARMEHSHTVSEMAELVEQVTHADKSDRKTTLMEDVSRSTLESIVSHFQTLFEVPRISGIFPRMNEVYRQLGEYKNVHNALKSILGIPNSTSTAALVDAVGKLCHRYNLTTSDQLKKLLQTDDLNSVIKRLHEHKQFFPAFKGVMDKLFDVLGVSKMDEVVPAVRALKLLAS